MPVSLVNALEVAFGLLLVCVLLLDVFQTVVVPRRAPPNRLSAIFLRLSWRLWCTVGGRLGHTGRRESLLASFGSLAVILLLTVWVVGLIAGYGLIFHGLRDQLEPVPESVGTAFYFAGTALLTLGFGEIVAVGGAARVLALFAAASGLGLIAIVITLLFTLYGSFQRREVAVVLLEATAGAPPSGVSLLESYARAGLLADLPRLFADWQAWSAEVLDSHLAYPMLAYFRSSHTNDAWVSSLGAVMDAATLVRTTVANGPVGWATLCQAVGGHCAEDLVLYFGLPDLRMIGVEYAEFLEARHRLAAAGFELIEAEEAWEDFARLRSAYAGRINALARYFATPPAQWIGDRSPYSPRGLAQALHTHRE